MVHVAMLKWNGCSMYEKSCSKKFPRKFRKETMIDENGIIIYKLRNTPYYVEKETIKFDNRFVVPHNIRLCLKFCAHINVEICSQSMLIKYLFKYLTKGPDRIKAVIEKNICTKNSQKIDYTFVDETKNYINCRYITPSEAIWRLYE